MAGVKSDSLSLWAADFVALANAAVTVVSIFLVERMGRRRLLLQSMVGMIAGLILLGMSFFFFKGLLAGVLAVGALVIYICFFGAHVEMLRG